jgi:hypothetical protein
LIYSAHNLESTFIRFFPLRTYFKSSITALMQSSCTSRVPRITPGAISDDEKALGPQSNGVTLYDAATPMSRDSLSIRVNYFE